MDRPWVGRYGIDADLRRREPGPEARAGRTPNMLWGGRRGDQEERVGIDGSIAERAGWHHLVPPPRLAHLGAVEVTGDCHSAGRGKFRTQVRIRDEVPTFWD